jgi:reverse gyrase
MAPPTLEARVASTESDIQQLTWNVSVLAEDVKAMLESQKDIANLLREQALHERDIQQALRLAEMALQRNDDLGKQVSELEKRLEVKEAVDKTRIGMMQALLKYWPIWTGIAALGILSGLTIQNIKF